VWAATERSTAYNHSRSACLQSLPPTIDNDFGLNYPSESDVWVRVPAPDAKGGYRYEHRKSLAVFNLDYIVNNVTPGYATAVFVAPVASNGSGQRPRACLGSVTK
jgi:hypothetical protein